MQESMPPKSGGAHPSIEGIVFRGALGKPQVAPRRTTAARGAAFDICGKRFLEGEECERREYGQQSAGIRERHEANDGDQGG